MSEFTGTEQSLLASILRTSENGEIVAMTRPEFFTKPFHTQAWMVISQMAKDGLDISMSTFPDQFHLTFPDCESELRPFLVFANALKTPNHWHTYLSLCREAAARRRLGTLSEEIATSLGKGDAAKILADKVSHGLNEAMHLIASSSEGSKEDHMRGVTNFLMNPQARHQCRTGLGEIDRQTLYGSCMHLVAARYNIGKTPFALKCAYTNAVIDGKRVLYWSGEMEPKNLYLGLIAIDTGVSIQKLQNGFENLTEDEKKGVRDSQKKLFEAPITFLPWGRANFLRLKTMFEQEWEKQPFELAIIDQIPLIEMDSSIKDKNGQCDLLADQLFSLKQFMPAWWMMLIQLKTKNVEDRPDLLDVMWYTKAEQNADARMMIDRPSAERRRFDAETARLDMERTRIRSNKSLEAYQKAQEEARLNRSMDLLRQACFYQRGRFGFKSFEAYTGFDPDGRGFVDLADQEQRKGEQDAAEADV